MADDQAVPSLALALSDVEMLRSAYPDETAASEEHDPPQFPLRVTLTLAAASYVQLEWVAGYPVESNVQVARFRSKTAAGHPRLERAVSAVRATAADCLRDGVEGGLACCAAALDAWNNGGGDDDSGGADEQRRHIADGGLPPLPPLSKAPQTTRYVWVSGEPLLDRKSAFVAHLCRIQSEADVQPALRQLLSNPKLQRATHNMYAYRLTEKRVVRNHKNGVVDGKDDDATANAAVAVTTTTTDVVVHDNDDDGEDGAGSRLAHLLQMRREDGVLVVVSRWFGGVHLGPRRFAHIASTAQALLATHSGIGSGTTRARQNNALGTAASVR